MPDREERQIIKDEIARLERRWMEAWERYGVTSSRSTEKTMRRYGIDMATLHTGEDFVKPLLTLMKKRS